MVRSIIVLISGGGTNLQALIDAQNDIPARIVQVISNRRDAGGLQRAKAANISTAYHNLVQYKKQHPDNETKARELYDEALAKMILEKSPSLVVCAGWMHILAPSFLQPLEEAGISVINLHPALPGQFNGKDAIERAFAAYQKGQITKTGIMIHYVIEAVDEGEPILTREIDLIPGESLEELKTRIHAVEWKAIVEGTRIALQHLDTQSNTSDGASK